MIHPSTRKPILWLGAHKTGTTFLQKALSLSREALGRHGLKYMDLDNFRAKYTRPLIYQGSFGQVSPPDDDLNLIFDENIPNLVQHALSAKGLYPDIAARSHKICTHFDLTDPDIYFGVREYSGFLPSLYCEVLKSTPYRPFDQFYIPQRHNINWHDVIDRLRRAFPKSRIYVYLYENIRGNEARLLSKVTGLPAAEFTIPTKMSRPGFSHAAVETLFELSKKRLVTSEDVSFAINKFKKSKDFPSYQPFDEKTLDSLKNNYQNHTELISLRDDIELLKIS
jgi:hypothetical protein